MDKEYEERVWGITVRVSGVRAARLTAVWLALVGVSVGGCSHLHAGGHVRPGTVLTSNVRTGPAEDDGNSDQAGWYGR